MAVSQTLAEFKVIENLAVNDNHHGSIFVPDRLAPMSDIDDGQATEDQGDPIIVMDLLVIRAATGELAPHLAEPLMALQTRRAGALKINESGKSAHRLPTQLSHKRLQDFRSPTPAGNLSVRVDYFFCAIKRTLSSGST